ncbi:hypothetical protein KFK09_007188 [Dendrobium nobile]|uniref:Uncharacterized protein n=1 Tax=Dendrobium nobile TaxID=94219 RepID=A0A8T3BTM8_DENNO|nr:hypothetical protein KFK09_007188 [Dendrobium nobile]
MGKSGRKSKVSQRQRRILHGVGDDALPSSAYDIPEDLEVRGRRADGEEEEEDGSGSGDADLVENETSMGALSKFDLYQQSVQGLFNLISMVFISFVFYACWNCWGFYEVTKGRYKLLAEVLSDVCGRKTTPTLARRFLWHRPSLMSFLEWISRNMNLLWDETEAVQGVEDSIQVVINGVVVVEPHVEEWRSKNVDVSVDVKYESTFKLRIRHASLPGVEGASKKKRRGRRWRLGVERAGRRGG